MILLLSGEGPSDIGSCNNCMDLCDTASFTPGPMAIFIDQLVEAIINYSCLDTGAVRFISERSLAVTSKGCLVQKKKPRLPGKKKGKETGYFERNARALAIKAKSLMAELDDEVVSVLFRDADGTASTSRGLYEKKRDSMVRGFKMENYEKGIPMIPKPKSEAWLLCAAKPHPYNHCDVLENASGNDDSPNSLKQQFELALGEPVCARELAVRARGGVFDVHQINMPSMQWFKDYLLEVLGHQKLKIWRV